LRKREEQFGRISQQPQQAKNEEDGLKLFFDYIKASNEQIVGVCATILDHQKILELKIDEIDKKLSGMHIKEE